MDTELLAYNSNLTVSITKSDIVQLQNEVGKSLNMSLILINSSMQVISNGELLQGLCKRDQHFQTTLDSLTTTIEHLISLQSNTFANLVYNQEDMRENLESYKASYQINNYVCIFTCSKGECRNRRIVILIIVSWEQIETNSDTRASRPTQSLQQKE